MASNGSSTTTVRKHNNDRVRDNQRRCRARKKEYLTDIETRLKECYNTCAQADMQRATFTELQAENARLRTFLSFAGLSLNMIESITQPDAVQRQPNAAANPRLLKSNRQTISCCSLRGMSHCTKPESPNQICYTIPPFTPSQNGILLNSCESYSEQSSYHLVTSATARSQLSTFLATTSLGWLFKGEAGNSTRPDLNGALMLHNFIPSHQCEDYLV
jgi:hypothetical protein